MKVKDLVSELQKFDPESRVLVGYDGNNAFVEPSADIVYVADEEKRDSIAWGCRIQIGDVVIFQA